MTEKTIYHTRQISHTILVSLSMLLSINMFIQFSDHWFIKILFGSMASALELIKIYILVLAKDHFSKARIKDYITSFIQFDVYLGLTIISIIASLGFTLVSIEEQSLRFTTRQEVSDFRINSLIDELESNKDQIKIIQQNATGLEYSAVERNENANKQILEIQEKNRELITEIEDLQIKKTEKNNIETRLTSSDMFVLLGKTVNLEGHQAMFYMMLILVVLLEIAIAITTGTITKDKIEKSEITIKNSISILEYIDLMFNENGTILSDKQIAEKSNISLEEAKAFRLKLRNTTYKGKPLITVKGRKVINNFKKENILKIVKFYLDTNKLF